MDYRRTFRACAVSFADLVSRLPDDRWDSPGPGDRTVRELVGYAVGSALRQVPAVLAEPAAEIDIDSPEEYVAWQAGQDIAVVSHDRRRPGGEPGGNTATAQAGDNVEEPARNTATAQAGDTPGEPAANIAADQAGKATHALAAAGDDDVVTTPGGGMRVRDWIPTRTLELVLCGMDVARAAGVEVAFPAEAIEEATLLSTRVAIKNGDAVVLLRALTGRGTLPQT